MTKKSHLRAVKVPKTAGGEAAASVEGRTGGRHKHCYILADKYKTKICRNHEEKGVCPYEFRCMFAHGADELRTKEMNLQDGLITEEAIRNFRRVYQPLSASSDGAEGCDAAPENLSGAGSNDGALVDETTIEHQDTTNADEHVHAHDAQAPAPSSSTAPPAPKSDSAEEPCSASAGSAAEPEETPVEEEDVAEISATQFGGSSEFINNKTSPVTQRPTRVTTHSPYEFRYCPEEGYAMPQSPYYLTAPPAYQCQCPECVHQHYQQQFVASMYNAQQQSYTAYAYQHATASPYAHPDSIDPAAAAYHSGYYAQYGHPYEAYQYGGYYAVEPQPTAVAEAGYEEMQHAQYLLQPLSSPTVTVGTH